MSLAANMTCLYLRRRLVARSSVKPRLYQCCGTEVTLYVDNVRFRNALFKLPFDLTYEEGPGEHEWSYWDRMIQTVLRECFLKTF